MPTNSWAHRPDGLAPRMMQHRYHPPDHLPADESVDLFAYGSLQFPEVLRLLFGRVPPGRPVTVAGWRVVALPGQVYAALFPGETIAHGRLVTDLGPEEWRVLDAFQDNTYELRRLTLTDGRDAWAYVNPGPADALSDDWDADAFEQDHLIDYLKSCAAWRQKYKRSPNDH